MRTLLHAILACAHGIVNTRDTREMQVMSSHLVCHTTRVVQLHTGTVAVGNEIQLLCS